MPGSLAPPFSASRIRWKAAGVQGKRIHSRGDRKKRPATGRDEDYVEYAPEKKGRENKPPQIHRPDGAAPQRFFHIADTAFDGDGACKTSLLFQCGKTRRTFQKGATSRSLKPEGYAPEAEAAARKPPGRQGRDRRRRNGSERRSGSGLSCKSKGPNAYLSPAIGVAQMDANAAAGAAPVVNSPQTACK